MINIELSTSFYMLLSLNYQFVRQQQQKNVWLQSSPFILLLCLPLAEQVHASHGGARIGGRAAGSRGETWKLSLPLPPACVGVGVGGSGILLFSIIIFTIVVTLIVVAATVSSADVYPRHTELE